MADQNSEESISVQSAHSSVSGTEHNMNKETEVFMNLSKQSRPILTSLTPPLFIHETPIAFINIFAKVLFAVPGNVIHDHRDDVYGVMAGLVKMLPYPSEIVRSCSRRKCIDQVHWLLLILYFRRHIFFSKIGSLGPKDRATRHYVTDVVEFIPYVHRLSL